MGFLDFLKMPRAEELRIAEIRFLCEQDGPAERDLKNALVELLRQHPDIKRAYLVQVQYGKRDGTQRDGTDVALGLDGSVASRALVGEVSARFAALFGKNQHLDIIFLSPEQSAAITRVAKPFYSGAG
jgi:hypothetical protein